MTIRLSPRAFAFLVHLAGSMCLAMCALAWVYLVWCPGPIAAAVGVSGIVGVLLGVDVVLGPTLTAVLYKPGKPGLLLDLGVVVLIQLAAFGYGVWSIAVARPVWIVFSGYRFDLVQANDLDLRFQADTPERYRNAPWFGPKWVAASPPNDVQKRNQLIFESVGGGSDMPQRPDLYVPLEEDRGRLRVKASPLAKLAEINGADALNDLRLRWPQADGYFPLLAKNRHMTVLVNREQAKVIAVVDVRPFK